MARPRGSRSIDGWTYTPAQMESAGLLPEGSAVTKTVTQSDGSTITRTDVKQGIDPLAIFKGKTADDKATVKKNLRSARKENVNQAVAKAKKQKTSEQKAKQKQRITAQARKRIGALNDKQSELYDQVLQVRDAISQGKQLVETKRTAKRKFNANPEAGGLMTRTAEYKVSKQKATKAQLQKMYDRENELEGKMMKLESRKNQILKATQKLYR